MVIHCCLCENHIRNGVTSRHQLQIVSSCGSLLGQMKDSMAASSTLQTLLDRNGSGAHSSTCQWQGGEITMIDTDWHRIGLMESITTAPESICCVPGIVSGAEILLHFIP